MNSNYRKMSDEYLKDVRQQACTATLKAREALLQNGVDIQAINIKEIEDLGKSELSMLLEEICKFNARQYENVCIGEMAISYIDMLLNRKKRILEPGKTIAFDFDGVIHKYSKGWQDGSIYDEPNYSAVGIMISLSVSGYPIVIISTRDPEQIKEWWDKNFFGKPAVVMDFNEKFWNRMDAIGITNRKVPAQLYIDDRAYLYSGCGINEFFEEFEMEE